MVGVYDQCMAPQSIDEQTGPHPVVVTPANPRDVATEFVMAKAAAEYAAAQLKELRSGADAVFVPSDRIPVTLPGNRKVKLGTVNYTDPDPVAEVSDEAAFLGFFKEHHPEYVVEVETLAAPHADVIAALKKYVPEAELDELIEAKPQVADYMRNQILKRTLTAGEPVGPNNETGEKAAPGVQIVPKKSSVTVSLEADAVPTLIKAWQSGTGAPLGITV
jgi:hypothetical protein